LWSKEQENREKRDGEKKRGLEGTLNTVISPAITGNLFGEKLIRQNIATMEGRESWDLWSCVKGKQRKRKGGGGGCLVGGGWVFWGLGGLFVFLGGVWFGGRAEIHLGTLKQRRTLIVFVHVKTKNSLAKKMLRSNLRPPIPCRLEGTEITFFPITTRSLTARTVNWSQPV